MFIKCLLLLLCTVVIQVQMARILIVMPVPSVSHQIELEPLTQELVRRGHDVVIITPTPAFPKGKTPANLTEIDVKEVAYGIKKFKFAERATGKSNDIYSQIKAFFDLFNEIFDGELKTKEVREFMNDKKQHFDLVIVEGCVGSALIFAHIYKAPLIVFSSIGSYDILSELMGAEMHPLLYPTCLHQKTNNLSTWDKIWALYQHYNLESALRSADISGNEVIKRHFGANAPTIEELRKKVDMLFLTEYHIWDNNRPIPPGTLYLGGLNKRKPKELPKEIKTFLDSSKHGVIYMSFGTNVNSGYLPPHATETFVKVFSKLKYDVLLKWDLEELPGASSNVKIMKWLPQADLLHHPKIKLYIMQGGLQSTGEAISAGVPLLAFPMLGDQWYNAEHYKRLNIGLRLDMETLTEEGMLTAIKTIIEDGSYRRNMIALRDRIQDQPQSPLDRAVWWIEHVIRHKGAPHLRAPTAMISYWDFYQLDVVLLLGFIAILALTLLISALTFLYNDYVRKFAKTKSE